MNNPNEFQSTFASAMGKVASGTQLNSDEQLALLVRAPFYLQCVTGEGDPDLPRERSELELRARRADIMIERIESGVATLREKILEVTHNPSQHVLSPITRIQSNERNPLRNKYRFRIAVIDQRVSQVSIPSHAFFYMIAGEQREKDGLAASFRESDRTFFGNEHCSDASLVDGIVASHEAVHILQNDSELSRMTSLKHASAFRAKQVFLAERKRSVINAELPAFHRELQIANCALNRALENPHSLSERQAIEGLGATRNDQQIVVETILRLARVFPGFADHHPEHEFPRRFVAEIIHMYRASGHQICMQDASGNLTILE